MGLFEQLSATIGSSVFERREQGDVSGYRAKEKAEIDERRRTGKRRRGVI
jgi:hypothetical protein